MLSFYVHGGSSSLDTCPKSDVKHLLAEGQSSHMQKKKEVYKYLILHVMAQPVRRSSWQRSLAQGCSILWSGRLRPRYSVDLTCPVRPMTHATKDNPATLSRAILDQPRDRQQGRTWDQRSASLRNHVTYLQVHLKDHALVKLE